MIQEIIKNFSKQLEYRPEIVNQTALKKCSKFVVVGMGGSNLAAGIIKSWKPKLDIVVHRDYGLPEMEEHELKERLIILSSYSGTTEETVSAFNEALSRELPLIAITTGGKLLDLAQKNNVPYVKMPGINTSPRLAIGLSIKATLKAMGEETILNNIGSKAGSLNADDYEGVGRNLARNLGNKIPLIYSSSRNHGLAYFWKVNFNETAKTPAFFNVFPELNHNEIAGFSPKLWDGGLTDKFAFIFLTDPDDEPRIQNRIAATAKIFEDKGFTISKADVVGPSLWHKSFASILTAFWTSYYLAEYYGVDSEDATVIEEFKKWVG